jgi:ectoine hydroxylase-related dioxygenase (phytanoyl-CoA dioxygenase family)
MTAPAVLGGWVLFLSDIPGTFAGNLAVWPGSHSALERHFRLRGPRAMHEGMPPMPKTRSRQIIAAKGDGVLCHYQLAHAAMVNLSDRDRIAVYFRYSLDDLPSNRWRRLIDIWDGWRIRPCI